MSFRLFDLYLPKPFGPGTAAGVGLVWIGGRVLHPTGYMAHPGKR